VTVALVALLWLSGDDALAAAQDSYQRGKQLYKAQQYQECATEFAKAWALSQQGKHAYNAALCHRKAKAAAAAIEWFKKYLAAEPAAKDREKVEARIRELEASQPATAPPPAPVRPPPEDRPIDLAPAPAPAPQPYVPPSADLEPTGPIYKRWWFWAAVVVVAAAGVTAGVLASGGASSEPPASDLGTFEADFR
jgi:hypothetical protein